MKHLDQVLAQLAERGVGFKSLRDLIRERTHGEVESE
jgi:hypothetical protein